MVVVEEAVGVNLRRMWKRRMVVRRMVKCMAILAVKWEAGRERNTTWAVPDCEPSSTNFLVRACMCVPCVCVRAHVQVWAVTGCPGHRRPFWCVCSCACVCAFVCVGEWGGMRVRVCVRARV